MLKLCTCPLLFPAENGVSQPCLWNSQQIFFFFLIFSPVHLWNFSWFFSKAMQDLSIPRKFFFLGGGLLLLHPWPFSVPELQLVFCARRVFGIFQVPVDYLIQSLGNSKPGRLDRLVRWDLIPPAGAQYGFWAQTSTSRIKCSSNCATWPPLSEESQWLNKKALSCLVAILSLSLSLSLSKSFSLSFSLSRPSFRCIFLLLQLVESESTYLNLIKQWKKWK